jgi:hypothetical protein
MRWIRRMLPECSIGKVSARIQSRLIRETLDNPAILRENFHVIADVN